MERDKAEPGAAAGRSSDSSDDLSWSVLLNSCFFLFYGGRLNNNEAGADC